MLKYLQIHDFGKGVGLGQGKCLLSPLFMKFEGAPKGEATRE